jgi:hypothetical protein
LRTCFAASLKEEETPDGPPRGLAERTAVWVSESGTHHPVPPAPPTKREALAASYDPPPGALGWSLADLTVAGGVILAVSMLLFPAVRESRDDTRRNFCQNSQQQLGQLIFQYAEDHGRYFPEVQPNENAGIYTVRLVSANYISPRDLALLLVCPDAPAADDIYAGKFAVIIPTQQKLNVMSPDQLAWVRQWMSPTYAYALGYREGNKYHYVNQRRAHTPILGDAPSEDGSMTPNHGGSIGQALYPDGSVRVLTSCEIQGLDTDVYRNTAGEVAAGYGSRDAVLAPSAATPRIFEIQTGR